MIKFKKLYQCLKNPRFIKSYINGVSPLFELLPLIDEIRNVKTLIDIGSNKGQFSILLRDFFPNIKIYSFDPIKEEIDIQKKIHLKKNIKFYNFALGNKDKKVFLNITSRIDSSSILIPTIKNDIRYKTIEKRLIQLKKLDDLIRGNKIKKSIVMKLDVQGYELEVLYGAKNFLKYVDYLILEISFQKIYKSQSSIKKLLNFLKLNNFVEKKRCNISYLNHSKIQADVLFIKNNNEF